MSSASPDPEFAPSRLVVHAHGEPGPSYSLIFDDFGPCADAFEARGSEGGGYAWQGLAEALVRLHAPELEGRFRYDPESSMFAAYGPDREALCRLAGLIRAVQTDREMLEQALDTVDLNEYD